MGRRLRIESDTSKMQFHPLPARGELRLGSSRDNDIVVTSKGVSRNHARLTVDNDGVSLRDVGSKNRLIVSGERRHKVVLRVGEHVQIGSANVWLEDAASSETEMAVRLAKKPDTSSSAPRSETRDHVDDGSAAAGFQLVRRYHGEILAGEVRRQLLGEARAVLDASALFILDCDASRRVGEPVIAESSGALPDEDCCRELLAREVDARRGETVLLDHQDYRLIDQLEGMRLVARYAGHRKNRTQRPWITEFLQLLATLLSQPRSRRAPSRRRSPQDLQPPTGMILGESQAMQALLRRLRASLRSSRDVLLRGETGSGKELFAELIHRSDTTRQGRFVAVNCAAIPANLLEAELFGVVEGAATDVAPRPGRFQLAEDGTLLLDEIADLSLDLQAKLLRALEERKICSVGAIEETEVRVRVVATCNCDLALRRDEGLFRPDLYYRLHQLSFEVPALRERPEDVAALAQFFMSEAAVEYGIPIDGLSRRALRLLESHVWPGNVRELKAAVHRAVLYSGGGVLTAEHFADLTGAASPGRADTLKAFLDAQERHFISKCLAATGGNHSATARRLGVSRQGLYDKMERLGIS